MWDDKLEGKEVFYSDTITMLVAYVNSNNRELFGSASYSGDDSYPFRADGNNWRFVYYDPNYEQKLAYEQGKQIECKRKSSSDTWGDVADVHWWDDYEYRIKPEESKPVTNRELAKWLAQGNGEMCYYNHESCTKSCSFTQHNYNHKTENEPCKISELEVRVRKWEDTEWHELTREYMGLED